MDRRPRGAAMKGVQRITARAPGARPYCKRSMGTPATGEAESQRPLGDQERHDADRDADPERPPPGPVLDQEPAHQRPGHGGQAEHRADVALVAAALSGTDHVADDCLDLENLSAGGATGSPH